MCKIDEITLKKAGITTKPVSNRGLQKKNIVVGCGRARELQKGKCWILVIRLSTGELRQIIAPDETKAKEILLCLGITVSESGITNPYYRGRETPATI